jgi:uncharacterized protein
MATDQYSFAHAESLKHLIKWENYSPEAFDKSARENKPIFLLLTAPSWCYWCQVYESEEYLFHPEVVSFINNNFIPIYVDADQRQDITRAYLEGGWPSTTVFTPGRERIFGFSGPRPVQNMIENLRNAVEYTKKEVLKEEISYNYKKTPQVIPTEIQLTNLQNKYATYILQNHDSQFGGFGFGQKFPQGRALDYALQIYKKTNDEKYLNLVLLTLDGQYTRANEIEYNYNLFDPIEGGFHRYGTTRDYSPPHYEKMLYDNAKLLKAYSFLIQIVPENKIATEVVKKTHDYVKTNWYDSQRGGFYGNTDVHGEDKYYGSNPRPKPKPRVEKTKYTDWNSEAILTYLYLWKTTNYEEYKKIAQNSLGFMRKETITKEGAYHYVTPEYKKEVRGTTLDNSYALLAFINGYETLNEEEYLKTAKELADYSLENLYDWNSGGFFERNSPDKNLYPPGEHIDLAKPGEENSIMIYSLLKLHKKTGNPAYLNAAIKSLGNKINQIGGLDSGYYYIKSAEFILENNLLSEFESKKGEIQKLESKNQESFWVNKLIENTPKSGVTRFIISDKGQDNLQRSFFL